ncbi:MAG: hypothetical protein WCX28_14725, partial [Bacteriovoracaceae bacterium]
SPDHFPERSDALYEILHKCRSLKTDQIVITGDITNQAKPKEFAHARSILKEFDLLDPEKLTVTIGNHDIFGGPYYAEDVLSFPGYCRQTDYDGKVKEFYSAFRETFEGCQYVSGSSIFPYVKMIRDVVFVGINSVAQWSSLKNPLGSNGEVCKKQFHRLKEIFASDMLKGRMVVVLIHHHFNKQESKPSAGKLERLWGAIESSTMKLWKKKRIFSLFATASIGKVLHGHVHHHEGYKRKNIQFLNAGGTMFANPQGHCLFHLLHVQQQKIEHVDVRVVPNKRNRRSAIGI